MRRTPPPEFNIGDKAYISSEHIRTTRPTRKLAELYLGPYEIIGHPSSQSYTLRLPHDLRSIHPVFHVSQLEPVPDNTMPNRTQEPPPPVEIDGELEFEVAEILDSKLDRCFQVQLQYLVCWLGYEGIDEEQAWTSAIDLENSAELVEAFHAQNPSRPGSFEMFKRYIAKANPNPNPNT